MVYSATLPVSFVKGSLFAHAHQEGPFPLVHMDILVSHIPPPPDFSASQYKELMDYLSRDKSMAAMQLTLITEQKNKMRLERDAAVNAAAELRGQMNTVQDMVTSGRADLQVCSGVYMHNFFLHKQEQQHHKSAYFSFYMLMQTS